MVAEETTKTLRNLTHKLALTKDNLPIIFLKSSNYHVFVLLYSFILGYRV